jgi:hypothetical protein
LPIAVANALVDDRMCGVRTALLTDEPLATQAEDGRPHEASTELSRVAGRKTLTERDANRPCIVAGRTPLARLPRSVSMSARYAGGRHLALMLE